MTAEQILREIENLPDNERFQLAVDLAKGIGNLRWLLCSHPDQEMVKASCLHFLGDAAQEWYASQKVKNPDPAEFKLEVGKSYEVREPRYTRAHGNETVVKIEKMRVNEYGEKEFKGDQYHPLWYYEDGQYTGRDDTSMDFYDLVREIQ